jgi:hypothetical protein
MGYKIVVNYGGANVLGTGPLADKYTFDFYANMLGIYKTNPMLFDNLIYFIPETGKDGCFKVSDVIDASITEDIINVQVKRFYIKPLDAEHILELFDCSSQNPQKIATIDLKTGEEI